ncbi:tetratricopeptide repeat protein 24-like isoform X4 [Polypterus senegalus]|uniref:tetratricopeptide repeat protein 24-like isoform X4 n=1 Tax=Polypterus senegalus TaxID=55291 RepID=UPI00196450B6|nr:tetratricopeptide repeat protein 24-like isoform X4 [Polypterus senegalus]
MASLVKDFENRDVPALHCEIWKLAKAGREALGKDNYISALSLFKKAYLISCKLPDGPVQKACLFNLGGGYIAAGKAKKGLKCLTKCKQKAGNGKDPDLYFNIAIAYEGMKEYAKAVRFYGKALSQYKNDQADNIADTFIKMGYCSLNLEDSASASLSFQMAGLSYQQAGRPDDAAMALRESANYMIRNGNFSEVNVHQTLEKSREISKEIVDYRLKASVKRSTPSILSCFTFSFKKGKLLNDLGLHYAELKKFPEASECFAEAMNSCTGKGFSIRNKAVLLQNMGAIYSAIRQYEESLKYHTQAADTYGDEHRQWQMYEALGATHFSLGNRDQSIFCYKEALAKMEKTMDKSSICRKRITSKLMNVTEYQLAPQPFNARKQSS